MHGTGVALREIDTIFSIHAAWFEHDARLRELVPRRLLMTAQDWGYLLLTFGFFAVTLAYTYVCGKL